MKFTTFFPLVFAVQLPFSVAAVTTRKEISKYIFPGNNTHPESVALQPNTPYLYSVSYTDGTIYRGNLNSPNMYPFINGSAHNLTTGVGVRIHDSKLFIAGGTTGSLFVFSLETRELLHRFTNNLAPNATVLNDLVIDEMTGDVYVTDSTEAKLWRAPSNAVGVEQTLEAFAELAPVVQFIPGEFNANGIVMTPDRKYIIINHTELYALFRITLATKEVIRIDADGVLAAGDGLLYAEPYLYNVNGFHNFPKSNFINVIRIQEPWSEGKVVGNITNPLMDGTATIALLSEGKEMLAVNYQGGVEDPDLPFSIVRIPVEW